MLRIIILLLVLLFPLNTMAEEIQDVGISRYAVLEVVKNYTPVREKSDEGSKRVTHLFPKSILFADKQTRSYYRVELGDKKYWVNKKDVEVQAVIPEKRLENIEKVSFNEEKNKYQIKLQIPSFSAYIFDEKDDGLKFTLFDNRFDPTEASVSKNNVFKLPEKIQNDFEILYNSAKPLFGYDIESYDKGYIISVKKAPKINPKKPLKGIKIVVDAGHGGDEKGACAFGLMEKNINLEISKKLKKELRKRGAKVYLTRKKDKKIGLYERVDFAKEKKADILISIHQNSLPNRADIDKKYGVGTYYYYPQAQPLAKSIEDSLIQATNFRDDGVNYASFALTRSSMPISVLVECGYIIRKEEADKLNNNQFQKVIAKAITQGVEKYLVNSFASK